MSWSSRAARKNVKNVRESSSRVSRHRMFSFPDLGFLTFVGPVTRHACNSKLKLPTTKESLPSHNITRCPSVNTVATMQSFLAILFATIVASAVAFVPQQTAFRSRGVAPLSMAMERTYIMVCQISVGRKEGTAIFSLFVVN
jgi:hypothetical protein